MTTRSLGTAEALFRVRRSRLAGWERDERRREERRRLVVRAVLGVVLLSLLEGALRKWVLPYWAGPLTLLRDPFVIILYAYCLVHGFLRRTTLTGIWVAFATLSLALGIVQFMLNGYPLAGLLLGLRTYWLYMPLALVVAGTFREQDVFRLFRMLIWISVPYSMLIAFQYNAGPSAFINLGVGGDEGFAVMLTETIVRPFGLFTYTLPNVQFTSATLAALLAVFLAGTKSRVRPAELFIAAPAVAVMAVLTGSRLIYFQGGVIFAFIAWGLVSAPQGRARVLQFGGLAAFFALAAVLFVFVFPDMLQAMELRFASAASTEGSIWERISFETLRPLDTIWTAPYLGSGIGAGAPGVSRFIGLPDLLFGEQDVRRNLNELGLLAGLLMVMLRSATGVWIGMTGFLRARRGDVWFMAVAGFACLPIMVGPITHSPLLGFLPWLMTGILMIPAQSGHRRVERQS